MLVPKDTYCIASWLFLNLIFGVLHFIEYDALSRLGIDEPHEFISNRYSKDKMSGDLLLLSTCCVGKAVMSRIEGMVEEVLGSAEWADAMVSILLFL